MHRTSLPIKPIKEKLYVITVISNPARFRVRYDLYRKFAKHMHDSGAVLYTVEAAFGEREFEITDKRNAHHIQLRTKSELWHKENMINIGISRLPSDWKYVAWIDADVHFLHPDWVQETIHALQHYDVVQVWSEAHDLNPQLHSFRSYKSFCACYLESINQPFDKEWNNGISADNYASKPYWHSGYGWGSTRIAIDHLAGLIDFAILGSADHHMALGLIGDMDRSMPGVIGKGHYYQMLKEWEARAERYIRRNIGVVPGTILHYWHGKKSTRRYNDRWKILMRDDFDPDLDLKKDSQGLYQLTDRNRKLRDDLRFYFRQRDEDSIDND